MSLPNPVEPSTVKGGPVVVEYEPTPIPQKPIKPKPTPKKAEKKEELLTSKEFVDKYRNEVVTASWDPKVIRKCGNGAKQILESLGAKIKNPNIPMKEMKRLREIRKYKEELEGKQYMDDHHKIKSKSKSSNHKDRKQRRK